MNKKRILIICTLLLFALLLLADQVTKTSALQSGDRIFVSLAGSAIISREVTINSGVAFGVDVWPGFPFAIVGAFFFMYLLRVTVRHAELRSNVTVWISLAVMSAGIIGNLIDRFRYGGVVDFISISILPIFNLADVCLVGGCGLYILKYLRSEQRVSATKEETHE